MDLAILIALVGLIITVLTSLGGLFILSFKLGSRFSNIETRVQICENDKKIFKEDYREDLSKIFDSLTEIRKEIHNK
jgi:hypothetical protein